MMQYIVWGMGAFAAYNLWGEIAWLSVLVAIMALSYAAHDHEKAFSQANGEFPRSTATRFMLTFLIVLGILVYSFTV
jgi:hypothetical protein